MARRPRNPYYDPAKPHTTPRGFRNNYSFEQRTGRDVFRWLWRRFWGAPDAQDDPTPNGGGSPGGAGVRRAGRLGVHAPEMAVEGAFLRANRAEPTLTWVGHDTLLLQLGGLNVLTDPQFSARASPLQRIGPRRKVPPALSPAELPHIDVVLISHNHYDHLDRASVQALQGQAGGPPRFFVPLGLRRWMAAAGISGAVEQDWWEQSECQGLRIHQVPAQHFSQRTPWNRNCILWGGFVVEHPALRFYFAGDTGYTRDFADIAARIGPMDLAALPIGAYEPRWFMQPMHINPAEAVQAHLDLRARRSVAMHWGTFRLTEEPLDEPPRALASALRAAGVPPEEFWLLRVGETRRLSALLREPGVSARSEDEA